MSQTHPKQTSQPCTPAEPLLAVDNYGRVHGTSLPGRTQRALEEPMMVSLHASDGTYRVEKQTGSTYLVDVLEESCTCPDRHRRCKHRRRVERELALGWLPTPGGRLP
jgi:hypothetical protein